MNKNRRFSLFARLSGLFLVLVSFAIGGWTVSARSLASPFVPGTWTKVASNPVLSPGTSGKWDDKGVYGPGMILDGSTHKMWYTSYSTASTTKKIGYATSTNGTNWTKYASNPVLLPGGAGAWDVKGVYFPAIIKDGTTYKMWFTGVNDSSIGQVGYATSSNGTTWTKHASNPVLSVGASGSWDSTFVGMVSVVKVGSTYKMWYRGGSATGGAIGYATSPDGIAWTKQGIAIDGGSGNWDTTPNHPEVVFDGRQYHMWYSGCDANWDFCQEGYATSSDGAVWTRKGMILPLGASGAWDDVAADHAAVLMAGSTLNMWYSGHDGSTYRIGYASAIATILDNQINLPLVRK